MLAIYFEVKLASRCLNTIWIYSIVNYYVDETIQVLQFHILIKWMNRIESNRPKKKRIFAREQSMFKFLEIIYLV